MNIPVITIDGPSGAGKGTIAQLLARRLQFHLLDSGALYRILAMKAIKENISLESPTEVARLAANLNTRFEPVDEYEPVHVYLDDEDITQAIRTETAGKGASVVAVFPEVRESLMNLQRQFCQMPGLIADGRDMGTVVFPSAALKIYLTASTKARAERRYKQLLAQGIDVKLADLLEEVAARDARDSQRAVSPMKPAVDAIVVDTTGRSIDGVFGEIWQRVQQQLGAAQ